MAFFWVPLIVTIAMDQMSDEPTGVSFNTFHSIVQTSHFLRDLQRMITANEHDEMALIFPTRHNAAVRGAWGHTPVHGVQGDSCDGSHKSWATQTVECIDETNARTEESGIIEAGRARDAYALVKVPAESVMAPLTVYFAVPEYNGVVSSWSQFDVKALFPQDYRQTTVAFYVPCLDTTSSAITAAFVLRKAAWPLVEKLTATSKMFLAWYESLLPSRPSLTAGSLAPYTPDGFREPARRWDIERLLATSSVVIITLTDPDPGILNVASKFSARGTRASVRIEWLSSPLPSRREPWVCDVTTDRLVPHAKALQSNESGRGLLGETNEQAEASFSDAICQQVPGPPSPGRARALARPRRDAYHEHRHMSSACMCSGDHLFQSQILANAASVSEGRCRLVNGPYSTRSAVLGTKPLSHSNFRRTGLEAIDAYKGPTPTSMLTDCALVACWVILMAVVRRMWTRRVAPISFAAAAAPTAMIPARKSILLPPVKIEVTTTWLVLPCVKISSSTSETTEAWMITDSNGQLGTPGIGLSSRDASRALSLNGGHMTGQSVVIFPSAPEAAVASAGESMATDVELRNRLNTILLGNNEDRAHRGRRSSMPDGNRVSLRRDTMDAHDHMPNTRHESDGGTHTAVRVGSAPTPLDLQSHIAELAAELTSIRAESERFRRQVLKSDGIIADSHGMADGVGARFLRSHCYYRKTIDEHARGTAEACSAVKGALLQNGTFCIDSKGAGEPARHTFAQTVSTNASAAASSPTGQASTPSVVQREKGTNHNVPPHFKSLIEDVLNLQRDVRVLTRSVAEVKHDVNLTSEDAVEVIEGVVRNVQRIDDDVTNARATNLVMRAQVMRIEADLARLRNEQQQGCQETKQTTKLKELRADAVSTGKYSSDNVDASEGSGGSSCVHYIAAASGKFASLDASKSGEDRPRCKGTRFLAAPVLAAVSKSGENVTSRNAESDLHLRSSTRAAGTPLSDLGTASASVDGRVRTCTRPFVTKPSNEGATNKATQQIADENSISISATAAVQREACAPRARSAAVGIFSSNKVRQADCGRGRFEKRGKSVIILQPRWR